MGRGWVRFAPLLEGVQLDSQLYEMLYVERAHIVGLNLLCRGRNISVGKFGTGFPGQKQRGNHTILVEHPEVWERQNRLQYIQYLAVFRFIALAQNPGYLEENGGTGRQIDLPVLRFAEKAFRVSDLPGVVVGKQAYKNIGIDKGQHQITPEQLRTT